MYWDVYSYIGTVCATIDGGWCYSGGSIMGEYGGVILSIFRRLLFFFFKLEQPVDYFYFI